jgi:hypothetical protein
MTAITVNKMSRASERAKGQALVEFSLVIVIFMVLIMGVLEFGFAFGVKARVVFASRDAAAVAAESASAPATADASIIAMIFKDAAAPADLNRIDYVNIFWADANGNVVKGKIQQYRLHGNLFKAYGGWQVTKTDYPASDRCAYIGGLGCSPDHTGPDHIGVTIVYKYSWVTPLNSLLPIGEGVTYSETSLTTMEPIPAEF